ncbi:hypothetical protein [Tardiphaga sp.]|jgi:hypothetical protein|uniref:hypothetical protein n=1 Tax=Tardiphaga sp. TaxID=1926292 RepID=UPI0037D9C6EE
MFSYFERVAADLWDGHWDTIVHTRNACDVERLHLEAAILCKYGKSLSLRGSPETVRVTLAAARIDAETRDARRRARVRQASIDAADRPRSCSVHAQQAQDGVSTEETCLAAAA